MTSKLRKVIATIMDQTSISLAKVSATNLKVAILKATTHKEIPVDDRFVDKVLLLTLSSATNTSACIHALELRMARTHNWVVALKSLNLVFRILQEGNPRFDQQVLNSTKHGSKLLDLSNFRDDSNTSPWDYTAFVRTFARYLDERLYCTLMGKLHHATKPGHRYQHYLDHVNGAMKLTVLLDKITYWQRLLDRVLATQPTGLAKSNRLVQLSLYSVVLESFDLYRDISNGITFVLDNFFLLQHKSCVQVFHACDKAAKQFNELAAFYGLCKSLGVGRKVEYPYVQKISENLLGTLKELLKDNEVSSKINKSKRFVLEFLALPAPPIERSISWDQDFTHESNSEDEIEQASLLSKQNDPELALIDFKETVATMTPSINQDDKFSPNLLLLDFNNQQQQQQQPPSSQFCLCDQNSNSNLDLVLLGDPSQHQQQPSPSYSGEGRGWETVLTECAERMSNQVNFNKSSAFNSLHPESLYNNNNTSVYHQHQNYSNPFIQGESEANVCPVAYSPFP